MSVPHPYWRLFHTNHNQDNYIPMNIMGVVKSEQIFDLEPKRKS